MTTIIIIITNNNNKSSGKNANVLEPTKKQHHNFLVKEN